MTRLLGLLRPAAHLSPEQRSRLARWQALAPPSSSTPLTQMSWVVLDVESTGLDVQRDRPLSIGAVGVEGDRIVLQHSFSRVLRQERVPNKHNVVIHGIGPGAQDEGQDPTDALLDFLAYAGKAPRVAYHAPFDRELLGREVRRRLGVRLGGEWLDLAWLLPALFPDAKLIRQPLDAWLAHFRLEVPDRHRADVDAFMTAELLLIALKRARGRGIQNARDLTELARAEALTHTGAGRGF